MNFSSGFKWALATVLALAIGWKMVLPPDYQGHLKEDLVEFLERNHFNVVARYETGTLIISANAASCQMHVAKLTPDGSNANLVRHLTAGAQRSFVVFRSEIYTQQPVFWTVLDYLWSRFLRELRLTRNVSPVIDVAESSSCNAERLPWGELER
ncbi:hypothetical protein I6F35_10730 [Bradyrhizobium sp. BRP22]|uniref:hypothetical protein n=1 Tax=Bradyrhizobium sp. BRP22 TaxID=2793821 RepID=UPI001CD4E00D|nr:hypothetical protein [Bradyrhizobium sp. BRP22]MCA1453685.1 hypothetical protein [Bradyrhizobium sp. BRP22]